MGKHLPLLRDARSVTGPLTRRELIRWVGAMAAAGAVPGCSSSSGSSGPDSGTDSRTDGGPPPPASFLTAPEQQALAMFADYVMPPDHQPGGSALGVVQYVEQLLTALDGKVEMIFAGGPYSGRQPYATADGAVGTMFPVDSFTTFIPLDRYRQAAWKLRLSGSSAFPGGFVNDAVLGSTVGLREQVPQILDAAIALSKVPLDTKAPAAAVTEAWNNLPADGKTLLTELVIEGCFSSPEYGGNVKLAGFEICNFEGDSQPLGYSLYDEKTQSYNQRPDAPVSTPNPGADPDPMDDATRALIKTLVSFAGGKVFF
jgi:hypothetical protein